MSKPIRSCRFGPFAGSAGPHFEPDDSSSRDADQFIRCGPAWPTSFSRRRFFLCPAGGGRCYRFQRRRISPMACGTTVTCSMAPKTIGRGCLGSLLGAPKQLADRYAAAASTGNVGDPIASPREPSFAPIARSKPACGFGPPEHDATYGACASPAVTALHYGVTHGVTN